MSTRFFLILFVAVLSFTPVWAQPRIASLDFSSEQRPQVVLDAPAPAEGMWIELHANGPVHPPRAVYIPAGETRATFELVADPVEEDTTVQIHALSQGYTTSEILVLEASAVGYTAQK